MGKVASYNETVDVHLLGQEAQGGSYSLAEDPKQGYVQLVYIHLQCLENEDRKKKNTNSSEYCILESRFVPGNWLQQFAGSCKFTFWGLILIQIKS